MWNIFSQHYVTKYTITTEIECKNYIGIILRRDYINKYLTLSMPNYVTTALHKFQHVIPSAPENSPHIPVKPWYGTRIQYAYDPEDKDVTINHKSIGTFLY